MIKKLEYVKVNADNIKIAQDIQKQEWPDSVDDFTFYDNLINGNEKNINFLVYFKNEPIGITGVYEENNDKSSLWLDWFCVIQKYRGMGFGKQILLDTIDYAKQFDDIEFFRIESNLSIERESTNLYLKTMDFIEKYTAEDTKTKTYGYYICTKCLKSNSKYVPWNNRFLDLNKHYEKIKSEKNKC